MTTMGRFLALSLAAALLAGCTGNPNDDAPTPDTDTATAGFPTNATVLTNISFKGRTDGAYCVGTMLSGRCVPTSEGENDAFTLPEVEGKPLRFAGQVVWEADSDEAKEFTIALCTEEGCIGSDYQLRGPSPLLFDWDLSPFEANASFGVRILANYGTQINTVEVGGEVAEDFEVTAVLTVAST